MQMDRIDRQIVRGLSEFCMLINAAVDHLRRYTFLPNLCERPGSDMTSIRVAEPRETTFYSIIPFAVYN